MTVKGGLTAQRSGTRIKAWEPRRMAWNHCSSFGPGFSLVAVQACRLQDLFFLQYLHFAMFTNPVSSLKLVKELKDRLSTAKPEQLLTNYSIQYNIIYIYTVYVSVLLISLSLHRRLNESSRWLKASQGPKQVLLNMAWY